MVSSRAGWIDGGVMRYGRNCSAGGREGVDKFRTGTRLTGVGGSISARAGETAATRPAAHNFSVLQGEEFDHNSTRKTTVRLLLDREKAVRRD